MSTHGWVDTALLGGAAYGALSTNKSVQRNTALLGAKLDFQTFATLYPEEAKAHLAKMAAAAARDKKIKQVIGGTLVSIFGGIFLFGYIVSQISPSPVHTPIAQAKAESVAPPIVEAVTETQPALAAPALMSCSAILADAKQKTSQPVYQMLQHDYNDWRDHQTSNYDWSKCTGKALGTIGLWAGR
jgi:hypothetical protein